MIWLDKENAVDIRDNKFYFHPDKGWDGGCEGNFNPMKGKVDDLSPLSIKVYMNKNTRDRAHYVQNKVAQMGFAPPVGHKFNFYLINTIKDEVENHFGYFTCRAKITREMPKKDFKDKIKAFGFNLQEITCGGNSGVWRGHDVIIDFGPFSWERSHDDKMCPSCMFCEVMT